MGTSRLPIAKFKENWWIKAGLLLIGLTAVLSGCGLTPVKQEQNDWSSIWIEHANQDGKPRLLFVGDSVMDGYYDSVSEDLQNSFYPAWFTTSKFVNNPDFRDELRIILRRYQFEIILFNNGLHGWDYSEEQYRTGLIKIVRLLKNRAPDSTLIWVETTPVRLKSDLASLDPLNQRVIERNQIAQEIMDQAGIPVIHLYQAMLPHPEYYRDQYHFNQAGKSAQAQLITEFILNLR